MAVQSWEHEMTGLGKIMNDDQGSSETLGFREIYNEVKGNV